MLYTRVYSIATFICVFSYDAMEHINVAMLYTRVYSIATFICVFSYDAMEQKFIQSYLRAKKEVNNTVGLLTAAIHVLYRYKQIRLVPNNISDVNNYASARWCFQLQLFINFGTEIGKFLVKRKGKDEWVINLYHLQPMQWIHQLHCSDIYIAWC